MRSSLRNRLLGLFLLLFIVIGAGTLYWIQHTLADDLLSSLETRLTDQGRAVATWLSTARHVEQLAPRLAQVTGTRITIVGADGLVQGDSLEPSTVGRPIGAAWEVQQARKGLVGRAVRELKPDEPKQYLVAVPGDQDTVIRLAVPLGDIIDARARMRNRLLAGFGFGFLGALLLSWIFVRAITRPIQAMTRTAEQLAAGSYDVQAPTAATEAGGELGVLARAMMHMAGEVKARVGELTQQRDLLSVVFAGLVEGVVVVERGGNIVLANDAARPLIGEGGLPAPLVALVARALGGKSDLPPSDSMTRGGGKSDLPPSDSMTRGGGKSDLPPSDSMTRGGSKGHAEAEEELELVGRNVRASASPLAAPGSGEGAAAAIVVLYDVTRMRALEGVRREFLSNAAHELRTPVTSISGYAETLLGGGVDADTSREFLSTIHRNAQRIAHLVSDLLVLDQLEGRASVVGERVPVALAQVVGDAARTTKGVTPSAQIDVDVPAELAVLGTRDGLDHVVQNLIDNAVKYGADTPVTVHAEVVARRVRLTVRDHGPGIPRGHEGRVFERFYRLDAGRSRDRGGSGLGLAIVKSQVDAMGGRVWVEQAEPGARFVVELDLA